MRRAGGMGTVHLSYPPGGRPIALKVIRPEFSEDPEFRRRFQQEVKAAQRVQGLYTAPVIDFDTGSTQPWLATAYVPGPSLAHAVSQHGRLPLRSVLLLAVGVAEALHVIHGAGIVHRDLKPANVLLAADGPRVIDFGIARAADATSLTGHGVSVGTPAFMAPEQASAGTVPPHTDIFALGQIVAFAAIGAPAYGEGSSHAVLYRIVHEDPDLGALPAELRPLVTRCLSRDPADRPSLTDVIQMCHDLSPAPPRSARARTGCPRRSPVPSPSASSCYQTPPPGYGPGYPTPAPSHHPGYPPAVPKRKRTGLIVAGSVVAAVIGIVVIVSLLPKGSDNKAKGSSGSAGGSGSAGAGTTSGGSSGKNQKPAEPTPASYKGINLTANYQLMLADNPPRPGTGGSAGVSYNHGDLYFSVDTLFGDTKAGTDNGKLVVLNNSEKGSLETCRTETRYTDTIGLDQLTDGSEICVLSDAGHIAVATYRGKSGTNDPSKYITLYLKTWRNAEEPRKR
ncbi:serine/threonine protein kinase [Streptomyces violascens]|uniref:serine/threonine protein kinase n=1 Tax=Streptomyces violascens TaxID=67381 RepID=UPI0037B52EB1